MLIEYNRFSDHALIMHNVEYVCDKHTLAFVLPWKLVHYR